MSKNKRLKSSFNSEYKDWQGESKLADIDPDSTTHKLCAMWQDGEEVNIVLFSRFETRIQQALNAVHKGRKKALKLFIQQQLDDKYHCVWNNFSIKGCPKYQLFDDTHYCQCVKDNLRNYEFYLSPTHCVTCLSSVDWGYYDMCPETCSECFKDTYCVQKYDDETMYLKIAQIMEFLNLFKINRIAAIQYTIDLYDKHHKYDNVSKRTALFPNYKDYFKEF